MDLGTTIAEAGALQGPVSHPAQETSGASSHSVIFYEDDSVMLDGLCEHLGSTLGAGGACVVVATRDHRERLAQRLGEWGFDVAQVAANGRYTSLDAERTLASFLVDGWPDETLFCRAIEPALVRARAALRWGEQPVAAFGEMVALLWASNRCEAAIRLEQLWNQLAVKHSFSLRCAYPLSGFADDAQCDLFRQVCAEHSALTPAETYTSLRTEQERLRLVSTLQQKALALDSAVKDRELQIAQRRRAEDTLRRSEQFARSVLESSIDCVKVLNVEGRLEYMSPPGQRAMGIRDDSEFLGRRWVDFWKDEDRSRAEAAVEAARSGVVGSFQGDSATLEGVVKSWDVKISPSLGDDGKVERLIAVSRDITDLKCAQKAVIQTEKLAAAGRLAATIAHEINNPLEAVTNLIYLARNNPDVPAEIAGHLEMADQELGRVAQIAQQTLGFYRDNSRQEWIDVAEILRSVMPIYESRAASKRLAVEIRADEDARLRAKQGELRQMLTNLIANAIDASGEGGRLRLRVRTTRNWTNGMEPGVRITVADHGSGMTAEVQQRIFDPFFTTKGEVGTGIGLWVTKTLIERQHGYIRFRSRRGENSGTVMSFFLPLTQERGTGVAHALRGLQ